MIKAIFTCLIFWFLYAGAAQAAVKLRKNRVEVIPRQGVDRFPDFNVTFTAGIIKVLWDLDQRDEKSGGRMEILRGEGCKLGR